MSANAKPRRKAQVRKNSAKPASLNAASLDEEIITAFMDAALVSGPPILPASIPAALALNRRLLGCAMSIVEACRLGSDSMLAPINIVKGDPSSYEPDFDEALTVVYRILKSVSANEDLMARIYAVKTGRDA